MIKKIVEENVLNKFNGHLTSNGNISNPNGGIAKLAIEGITNMERGLRILGKELDFSGVKIPLLGLDSVGRLVVLEVADKEEQTILFRIIDDFDWVFTHTEEISKRFNAHDIDISLSPRVILVLPQFSQDLLKRITYLGYIDLQIYTYRIINHTVPQNVTFELVSFSSQRRFTKGLEEKSVDELLNYIENPSVKIFCQKVLEEIKRLFPQCSIVSSVGYISVQANDKEFFGIYPHRNFFWFNISKKIWKGIYVNNPAQLENILSEIKTVSIRTATYVA